MLVFRVGCDNRVGCDTTVRLVLEAETNDSNLGNAMQMPALVRVSSKQSIKAISVHLCRYSVLVKNFLFAYHETKLLQLAIGKRFNLLVEAISKPEDKNYYKQGIRGCRVRDKRCC